MNTLLEAPAHEAETTDPRHNDAGVVQNENESSPNQSSPVPLWVNAISRTIGFKRRDLERTHWQKLSRSMRDD